MTARFLRLHVQTWHLHPSLRMEILGCQGELQRLNIYETWLNSKRSSQSATRLSARYRSPRWRRLATRTDGRDIMPAGQQSLCPWEYDNWQLKPSLKPHYCSFCSPWDGHIHASGGWCPKRSNGEQLSSLHHVTQFDLFSSWKLADWWLTPCSQITSGCRWT